MTNLGSVFRSTETCVNSEILPGWFSRVGVKAGLNLEDRQVRWAFVGLSICASSCDAGLHLVCKAGLMATLS